MSVQTPSLSMMPNAMKITARPGIVLVKGKGGGMGRLSKIPPTMIMNPIRLIMPGQRCRKCMRGRTSFSTLR